MIFFVFKHLLRSTVDWCMYEKKIWSFCIFRDFWTMIFHPGKHLGVGSHRMVDPMATTGGIENQKSPLSWLLTSSFPENPHRNTGKFYLLKNRGFLLVAKMVGKKTPRPMGFQPGGLGPLTAKCDFNLRIHPPKATQISSLVTGTLILKGILATPPQE